MDIFIGLALCGEGLSLGGGEFGFWMNCVVVGSSFVLGG